jgi:hypothetical protein
VVGSLVPDRRYHSLKLAMDRMRLVTQFFDLLDHLRDGFFRGTSLKYDNHERNGAINTSRKGIKR